MLYSLNLSKFKNLRIILTHKYLILVNKNGVINLTTNFFNIFIDKNLLFLNFNFYNFTKIKSRQANYKYFELFAYRYQNNIR